MFSGAYVMVQCVVSFAFFHQRKYREESMTSNKSFFLTRSDHLFKDIKVPKFTPYLSYGSSDSDFHSPFHTSASFDKQSTGHEDRAKTSESKTSESSEDDSFEENKDMHFTESLSLFSSSDSDVKKISGSSLIKAKVHELDYPTPSGSMRSSSGSNGTSEADIQEKQSERPIKSSYTKQSQVNTKYSEVTDVNNTILTWDEATTTADIDLSLWRQDIENEENLQSWTESIESDYNYSGKTINSLKVGNRRYKHEELVKTRQRKEKASEDATKDVHAEKMTIRKRRQRAREDTVEVHKVLSEDECMNSAAITGKRTSAWDNKLMKRQRRRRVSEHDNSSAEKQEHASLYCASAAKTTSRVNQHRWNSDGRGRMVGSDERDDSESGGDYGDDRSDGSDGGDKGDGSDGGDEGDKSDGSDGGDECDGSDGSDGGNEDDGSDGSNKGDGSDGTDGGDEGNGSDGGDEGDESDGGDEADGSDGTDGGDGGGGSDGGDGSDGRKIRLLIHIKNNEESTWRVPEFIRTTIYSSRKTTGEKRRKQTRRFVTVNTNVTHQVKFGTRLVTLPLVLITTLTKSSAGMKTKMKRGR